LNSHRNFTAVPMHLWSTRRIHPVYHWSAHLLTLFCILIDKPHAHYLAVFGALKCVFEFRILSAMLPYPISSSGLGIYACVEAQNVITVLQHQFKVEQAPCFEAFDDVFYRETRSIVGRDRRNHSECNKDSNQ
jgi:hypothetical protein